MRGFIQLYTLDSMSVVQELGLELRKTLRKTSGVTLIGRVWVRGF